MNWRDQPIENDNEGNPMFIGSVELTNDKNEHLGGIVWFDEAGPFYASAMDASDISLIRRIGPCTSLTTAKQNIYDAIEGKLNISNRAGYQRE